MFTNDGDTRFKGPSMLLSHDEYARERANRDLEFARAIRKRDLGLLNENEEDRRIARRILCDQLGLTEKEIAELERNKATA